MNKLGNWLIVVACFDAARNAIVVIIASSMAAVLYHNDVNKFTLTGNITSGIPSFKPPEFTLTHENHTYTVTDFFEVSKSTVMCTESQQHRTRTLKILGIMCSTLSNIRLNTMKQC